MNLVQDVRHSVRVLHANPGYSAVAVAILALGIGSNSVIFTVINEAFLRSAPGVAQPKELVGICFAKGNEYQGLTHPEYLDLIRGSHSFSGIIAFEETSLNLRGNGSAAAPATSGSKTPLAADASEAVAASLVSGNYFDVLGVRPILGRTFTSEEDRTPGTHPVVVLSHALWQSHFGGNRAVLGSQIVLNGTAFQVIGVAPPKFSGTALLDHTDLWIPLMMEGRAHVPFPALGNRLFHSLSVIARLGNGVTLERAQAELTVIGGPIIAGMDPGQDRKPQGLVAWHGIRLNPEESASAWEYVRILAAVSGFILVIACANVANLLLAKAAGRRREIAVRLALGATRRRLIYQFLIEGTMLGIAAGAAGFGLSLWTRTLLGFIGWAHKIDLTPDYRVLLGTFGVSLLAAILFSLAPALAVSKPDLVPALKDGAAGSGASRSRLRSGLVILQMALCVILLTGAGLCVRTLLAIRSVDPGFASANTLVAPVDLHPLGYPDGRVKLLQRQLVERAGALPGVSGAVLAASAPVGWNFGRDVLIEGYVDGHSEGHTEGSGKPRVNLDANSVTPGYFQLLRIPILRGRDFTAADTAGAPPVAIVNQAMARKYWPDRDAIDQTLRPMGFFGPGPPARVIAVVADTRRDVAKTAAPGVYFPLAQQPEAGTVLLLRTAGDPAALAVTVRGAIRDIDPDVATGEITTLDRRVAESVEESRENAILIGSLGFLALILAATGLYAVMSYGVTQRTREIGVRMALGANRGDVLRLVVKHGMLLTLLGDAVGIAAAAGLARFMASLLYEVTPVDALTYAGVSALLAIVALAASLMPALRATRVDPMVALRHE
jgi:predicted permease